MIAPFYLCKNWLAAGLIIKLHNTVGPPDVHAHFSVWLLWLDKIVEFFFLLVIWLVEAVNNQMTSLSRDQLTIEW